MASLIYVTQGNSSLFVRRYPLWYVGLLPPGETVLTAIIRQHGEPTPELGKRTKLKWHKPRRVRNLEVIVAENSQFEMHRPRQSGSDDSDALYFGKNDKLGILLQYLGRDAWRTNDAVAHTSIHHHEISSETYYLLDGAASVLWHDVERGNRRLVSPTELGNQVGGYLRGFTVRPYVQHPVVACNSKHSVMLLVTDPPNNTRDDHHPDGLFRKLLPPEVIAFYTQRTRGPSATG
ncbi:hypothetical protein HYV83_03740 [Candidatus Woesearchaeota archaeon]|nr:hypothetical protein [Candidatus Woesearchaeota archaeon]